MPNNSIIVKYQCPNCNGELWQHSANMVECIKCFWWGWFIKGKVK